MQEISTTVTCNDHRQVLASLEAYRVEAAKREAEKRRQANIDALLKTIPVRFAGKTFADFEVKYPAQAEVKRIVEKYADTYVDRLAECAPLILSGKTGTGKTLLAYVLFQYLIKKRGESRISTLHSFSTFITRKTI